MPDNTEQILQEIVDTMKDRLALVEHYMSIKNYNGADEAQLAAFMHIAKTLKAYKRLD